MRGLSMKKRLLSLVLALMMVLGMFPATASAVEPPLTADELFVQEMETTYGVQVTWPRGIPPTEEEKGFIREGLEFWGKEFIQAMSAISRTADGLSIYDGEPIKIILQDSPPPGVWGQASNNALTLYIIKNDEGGIAQQWDTTTFTHEFTHVVHNMALKTNSMSALFTDLAACNGDRKYRNPGGETWDYEKDSPYFAWDYGKTSVREDMATMIPVLLDTEKLAEINAGKFPAFKAKFNTLKKNLALSIGPTNAFDVVKGLDPAPTPQPGYACLTESHLLLKVGDTHQIKVSRVLPMGANQNPGFIYSSTDPSRVSVDENGLVTARKPTGAGSFYVYVTPKGTGTTRSMIHVGVPEGELPTATGATLRFGDTGIPEGGYNIGDTIQLETTFKPAGSTGKVCFTSLKPEIATVDQNGLLTIVGSGKGTVKHYIDGRYQQTQIINNFNVNSPVYTAIAPEQECYATVVGSYASPEWKAESTPIDKNPQLIYTSSDDKIAMVEQLSRRVYGKKPGEVTITAAANGISAACTVYVNDKLTKLTMNYNDEKLYVGDTFQLTSTYEPTGAYVGYVEYYVGDSSRASIDSSGLMTIMKTGKTYLAAEAGGARDAKELIITARPAATGIQVSDATVPQGGTATLLYTLLPEGAKEDVTFKSSNESVAAVDAAGVVTGKSAGTATITVTTVTTKKSATCTITVPEGTPAATPVFSPNLSTELVTYNKGATTVTALSAPATVSDGGTITYQWYSNDDANTNTPTLLTGATTAAYTPAVTAVGETYYYCVATNTNNSATGAKTVTATSHIAHIKVVNPVQSIAITKAPTKTTYVIGESFEKAGMVVTATYADNTTAAVTDYTVSPNGALKLTDTQITVSYTEDGVTKTTTQSITVNKKSTENVANTVSVRYNATGVKTHNLTGLPTDLDTNATYTVGAVTGDTGILSGTTCTKGILSFTMAEGTVGQTAIIPVTVSSGNYKDFVVSVTVKLIDKNNVDSEITFADGERTYTGSELTYETATIAGITAGANPKWTYTYVAGTGTLANGQPLAAGTYTVTATYEDDENMGSKTAALTVKKADSEVVPAPDKTTYTYGDTVTLTATVGIKAAKSAAPNTVEFFCGTTSLGVANVVNGKAELTYPTTGKGLAVGNNTIKAVYSGSVNLNGSDSDTITVTLNAKPLTGAVAAGITKVYDGNANFTDIGVTLGGVQSGDTITATAANIATIDANAGATKAISTAALTLTGDAKGYYTAPATLTGTVAITQKPITVNVVAVADKVYDGTTAATITDITFDGIVSGETLAYPADVTATAAFEDTDAKDGKTVNVTAITLASTANAKNYSMAVSTVSTTANITPATFSGSVAITVTEDKNVTEKLDSGDVLTATVTADLQGTLSYQWKNGEDVVGEDSATYTLGEGKVGTITCVVTSSGNVVGTLTAEPLEIGKIGLVGTIAITGDTTVGSTLTLDANGVSSAGQVTYAILWSDDSTGKTYTVQQSDLGKNVSVTITGTDGYTGSLTATLAIPAVEPDAPVITAVAGDGTVTVSWTAPFDGGSAITGYTLTVTPAAGGTPISVAANATSHDVTGLTNDTEYSFTLTAANNVGGTDSETVAVTPKERITVTYSTDGGTAIDPVQVIKGETLTAPTPTKSGYDFAGWFTDAELKNAFVQTTPITEAITLYAKWTVHQSSGGGTVTPPAPKPETPTTDPDTGNTNVAVPVKPVNKNGVSSATVPDKSITDAIAAAKKEAAKTGGTTSVEIKINAPKDAKTVEATLSAKGLMDVSKNTDGLKITGGMAALSFDKAALGAIADGAGKNVKISIAQADPQKLTAEQRAQIEHADVFNFAIMSGNQTISDFGGGVATVTLPYTLSSGEAEDKVGVWYLDATGKLNKLPATYDAKTQVVTFTTGHFSYYVVGYDKTVTWVNPFSDVAETAWYFEAVRYANQNGLLSGTSEGTFGPATPMTRAMLWTVLYRMADAPNKTEASASWYADAQSWTTAEGISDGANPTGNVTREQLATILYRYAKAAAVQADMSDFSDAGDISDFAKDGMSWAIANGILQGDQGKLNPKGSATRAEVAVMLQRFLAAQAQ